MQIRNLGSTVNPVEVKKKKEMKGMTKRTEYTRRDLSV
jgi:hypothetical protein